MTEANTPQPAPIPNDQPSIWQLVMEDMRAREKHGVEKYKTVLQINDGRDHLIDAYQELLDLVVYLRQEIEQRKHDAQVAGQWAESQASRLTTAFLKFPAEFRMELTRVLVAAATRGLHW